MLNREVYIITLGSSRENNEEMKPKIKVLELALQKIREL